MAPKKKKKQGASAAIVSPIDPNSQLPIYGNYASLIFESDLLRLVRMGVPPQELSSWRVCKWIIVSIEDTHKLVVFAPFLIQGLGLLVSSFFR